MLEIHSFLNSDIEALAEAAKKIDEASKLLENGQITRMEYESIVDTVTDLNAIDDSMCSVEQRKLLFDGIRALAGIARSFA